MPRSSISASLVRRVPKEPEIVTAIQVFSSSGAETICLVRVNRYAAYCRVARQTAAATAAKSLVASNNKNLPAW